MRLFLVELDESHLEISDFGLLLVETVCEHLDLALVVAMGFFVVLAFLLPSVVQLLLCLFELHDFLHDLLLLLLSSVHQLRQLIFDLLQLLAQLSLLPVEFLVVLL